MKRTKTTQHPDAILTSDWHLREDQPTCRTDNYWEAQWEKVDFIVDVQRQYDCIVLHAGDLFHNWKPSPHLLSTAIEHLPNRFHTVYGQHDLPQHNMYLSYKSGMNTLLQSNSLTVLNGCHWGEEPVNHSHAWEWMNENHQIVSKKALVWHKMVYKGKKLWPDQTDPSAKRLLTKYPQFDLIVTGDNHIPFIEEHEGRLLVNPGSLMRMTAKQEAHRPRVYLWYADTNKVVLVYIPVAEGVVTREHIEEKTQRDERLKAFISRLDGDCEAAVSFEENLERFAKKNQITKSVMAIVMKGIES